MSRPPRGYEQRVLRLTLLSGLPAVLVALGPLWLAGRPKVAWTLTLLVLGAWLGLALRVRELVTRPLQTLANLLVALQEGDFSIRGRPADRRDALGAAMAEVNALADSLREQRLLAVVDLQRARREEERQAFQRLVRVLGHEINNSLAPIHSIAGNLNALLRRRPRPADLDEDLQRGLAVIERRAASLGRFLQAYARLARLPAPRLEAVPVAAWARRVAQLEERLRVEVLPGPEVAVRGDPDQLDQLLINLVRNAADAALETGGAVQIRWRARLAQVEVAVLDEGPGLPETSNLFVPFFTTKPEGSGIGLVLSRQIAEAHEGSLVLRDRGPEAAGCEARLLLPAADIKGERDEPNHDH